MKATVEKVSLKESKNGSSYLMGVMTTDEGSLEFKIWNNADDNYDRLYDNPHIKIHSFKMDSWNNREYMVIQSFESEDGFVYTRENSFTEELEMIKSEEVKELVKTVLEVVPDYFFSIPASSTGKYHPKLSLGYGGLIRHTKTAVKFADRLMRNEQMGTFDDDDRDIVIASLILHDSVKNGWNGSQFTVAKHPKLASELVNKVGEDLGFNDEYYYEISKCIASHMGQWNTNKNGKEILPKPVGKLEEIVHMADYLSATRFINVDFDE